jgi:subtilisin family serine protease
MKRVILTVVSTLFLMTNLFSQNRVWVTIPNIELASSELVNVVSFDKAFPSSKTRSLQDVYEIITTTSSEVLVEELKKRNDLFINPVVGPTYETLETPNDYNTVFSNQWALNLINATSVWDITKGSSNITIAITDANFHVNHEELIGKVDYISSNSSTDYTHGTAVSTIAAGNTNNTVGTSSIGYNSRLQLRAMSYNEMLSATYSGAKVINCSWASSCSYNGYAQQVIDEVYNNGSVIVASAGNGSTCGGASNLVYPASYNHVISVTSIGAMDNHERFMGNPSTTHQHNSMVDICAPGYDVPLTTAPGVYVTGNGTSFASPFVSGTVALMLSVNPCLSVDDIEYLLKESSDTNVYLINPQYINQLGTGRLNALKAVQMAKNFKTINGFFKESVDCVSGNKSLSVLNLDGVSPYEYVWSNGSTSPSTIVSNDGYYKVEITDSMGCRFVDSVYAEKYFKMTVEEEKTDVLCFGMSNGGLSVNVLNGSNPDLPVWDNGFVGRDRNNLSVGNYIYSVVDNFGCEIIDTITINQPEKLVSTISGINPTSSTLGKVLVDVVGGVQPYEYEWNNGSIEEDLSYVIEGFYELLVTDRNGCMVSSNIVLEMENSLGVIESVNDEFKIFPNPSNGSVTIKTSKTDSNLSIVNINGQSVVTQSMFNGEVSVNDLSVGVYLVTVDNLTQKLIVK